MTSERNRLGNEKYYRQVYVSFNLKAMGDVKLEDRSPKTQPFLGKMLNVEKYDAVDHILGEIITTELSYAEETTDVEATDEGIDWDEELGLGNDEEKDEGESKTSVQQNLASMMRSHEPSTSSDPNTQVNP